MWGNYYLAHRFLFQRRGARAARRAFRAIPKLADVDFEFIDGPAKRVAVHPQLAGGAALVALVLLKDGEDKALLEFARS